VAGGRRGRSRSWMKRMTAEMMVDEVDRVRVVESERDQRKNKKKETHRDRGQNGKTAEMNMF
jgi:glucose-6-phosphate-specific signal transduction histidine kinase